MGLERVRVALLRGFDLPRGEMRDEALEWVAEQEQRHERRQQVICVATIATLLAAIVAALGAWIAAFALLVKR
jgi:hypothetical protein